eukprot:6703347-Prorocentrum_lima.AAC.1
MNVHQIAGRGLSEDELNCEHHASCLGQLRSALPREGALKGLAMLRPRVGDPPEHSSRAVAWCAVWGKKKRL